MKIPSAGTPVSIGTLLSSTLCGGSVDGFEQDLQRFLDAEYVGLSGSGTSALYAILQTLAEGSDRNEVVLPSYTAPSLVLPIRKAGLVPVLAEMSLETLNADSGALLQHVTDRTLAVMPVHMYGLASDTDTLAEALRGEDVYTVEDACSSMGTTVAGRQSGTWCDIGFYSFNRGKNMATLAGGAYSTSDAALAAKVNDRIARYPSPPVSGRIRNVALTWALAAAVHPAGYTALYPLVSRFKYTELHTDFAVKQYTGFQAGIGRRLLANFDRISDARSSRAKRLREGLAHSEFVEVPKVLDHSHPVYNQFPILLPDPEVRERIHRQILETGLEATQLYPEPVHRVYKDIWSGQGPDPFPNATEISRRILLIPVHPIVPESSLDRAIDIIRNELVDYQSQPAAVKEALN